jgi:hypothetical protein
MALDRKDKNNMINQPADPELVRVQFDRDLGILIWQGFVRAGIAGSGTVSSIELTECSVVHRL